MHYVWKNKTPDEKVDFSFEWGGRLAEGENLTASVWAVVAGDGELILSEQALDAPNAVASVFVSKGTDEGHYEIKNTVTTDSVPARTMEAHAHLFIRR